MGLKRPCGSGALGHRGRQAGWLSSGTPFWRAHCACPADAGRSAGARAPRSGDTQAVLENVSGHRASSRQPPQLRPRRSPDTPGEHHHTPSPDVGEREERGRPFSPRLRYPTRSPVSVVSWGTCPPWPLRPGLPHQPRELGSCLGWAGPSGRAAHLPASK